MKPLSTILCVIALMSISGFVWASCPEGHRQNDRTGECDEVPYLMEQIEAKKKKQEQEQKARKTEAKRKKQEQEQKARKAEAKRKKEEEERKIAEAERKRLEEEEKKKREDAEKKIAYLVDNLQTIPLEEIEKFLLDYQSVLDRRSVKPIANEYFVRSFDKTVSENGDVLKAIYEISEKAKKNNIDLSGIGDTGIHIVDISNERKSEEVEFPVILRKNNLPSYLQAKKSTLLEAIDLMEDERTDHVVIIQIASAVSDREISHHETVASEYLFKEELVPNPEYRKVQMDYLDTKEMFDWYNRQQAQCIASSCYFSNCCWNCRKMCNLYKTWKGRYDIVRKAFRSLDEYIKSPVYQPYEFRRSKVSVQKNVLSNIYLLDKKNEKYFVVPVKMLGEHTEYTLVHGLNQKDKSYAHERLSAASDESIARDAEAPQQIELSKLFKAVSVTSENMKILPSLDALERHILGTATEVTKKKDDTIVVTTKTEDKERFESVVVIFHPRGSIGSGFYVTEDTVLTNYHVIEGTSFLELALFNGDETFGKVIAKDLRLDLALVKVQARGEPVTFYREKSLTLGSTVEAIGHPSGLEFSITRGAISGIRRLPSRYDPGGKAIRFIQTDVAINPGNSGGPLYLGQKVVGVNTGKLVSEEIEGLNFAVHYNEVLRFLAKNGIE